MTELLWEPLPKRTKHKQKDKFSDKELVNTNSFENDKSLKERNLTNHDKVTQNVEARKLIQRIKTSLDSKDGCSGEYYEYLDHTADVQFHIWGESLEKALSNIAPCMFNFITDLSTVKEDPDETIEFSVSDFSTDYFCFKRVEIVEFSREHWHMRLKGYGDIFDSKVNPQGTEIKAITYSNMQIHEELEKVDIYVIVDI